VSSLKDKEPEGSFDGLSPSLTEKDWQKSKVIAITLDSK